MTPDKGSNQSMILLFLYQKTSCMYSKLEDISNSDYGSNQSMILLFLHRNKFYGYTKVEDIIFLLCPWVHLFVHLFVPLFRMPRNW